jgi:transposase
MRPPSVFVRPLDAAQAQRLKRMARTAKHFSTRQRAQILLASATGMSAVMIAQALCSDESHVRKVIAAFNDVGFESLRPNFGGGRPRKLDRATTDRVLAVALTRPQDRGVPITRWSLSKLAVELVAATVLSAGALSSEGLRRLLVRNGCSYQRTRTWKSSPDPDYQRKAARVLSLYRRAEAGTLGGVVVCFDEFGPLSIKPEQGASWRPRRMPERHRATYTRRFGVRYLLGAYDVGSDELWGEMTGCKDAMRVLEFLKAIRGRYPASTRIYLVMDNLSTHWTADIRRWARANKMTLVPTPTYASYLNRIECHFWALREFAINNSDHTTPDQLDQAVLQYLDYRNTHRTDLRIIKLVSRRKVA